ncbi:MAG: ABC transporter substrate-binding protein [Stigonema ocellatum SAG 48.90 = DSM 106950]|nr:ABC transporter substrate-binding protein [Stigonema ocellatum SAG 48.90 = DSM 106950]
MPKSNHPANPRSSFFRVVDDRVSHFVKPLNPFLNKLVEPLDPLLAKLAIYTLLFSSISLAAVTIWNLCDRYVITHKLVLVAGKENGESYILSQALAKVVEKHSNGRITIEVVKTDGTDENLEALEGRLGNSQKVSAQTNQAIQKAGAKHADLATAQADVIADTVAQSSASSARTVAALYPDVFQLVVRDALAPLTNQPFSSLKGKKIEVPNRGGQLTSFLSIAEHYGWKEKDFVFLTKDDTKKAFCNNEIDAVFRVRALGNRV